MRLDLMGHHGVIVPALDTHTSDGDGLRDVRLFSNGRAVVEVWIDGSPSDCGRVEEGMKRAFMLGFNAGREACQNRLER